MQSTSVINPIFQPRGSTHHGSTHHGRSTQTRTQTQRARASYSPSEALHDMYANYRSRALELLTFVVVAVIVWTGLTSSNGKMKHVPSSAVFPIALMEKYCDTVDNNLLDGTFATPETLIFFSMLAPVLGPAIGLLSAVLSAVIEWIASKVCCNETIREDFASWLKDKLKIGGGEGSDTKEFPTYEKYALEHTAQKARRGMIRSNTVAFAVMHLVLALSVLVDYASHINKAVVGDRMMCHASKVLVVPLFKAFAVSMWTVLMTVVNYVHWETSRRVSPKQVHLHKKMSAPDMPVNRNIFSTVILFIVAIFLGAWALVALTIFPTLVGFFPVVLLLLVVVPMLFLVLPIKIIAVLTNRWKKDSALASVEELLRNKPLLLLKVGMAQLFTTVILLAWFGGVYYGEESWLSASESLWSASIPEIVLSWPLLVFGVSFQWPQFSVDFKVSFYLLACSVGLLGVEYLLKAVQYADMLIGDDTTVPKVRKCVVFALRSLGTGPMAAFLAVTRRFATGGDSPAGSEEDGDFSTVTDSEVETYARNNTADLLVANFSRCFKLTNHALWSIAFYLNEGNNKGGDDGICVDIADCKNITDAGLQPFADKKVKITWVNLTHCSSISKIAVSRLIADCGTVFSSKKLLPEHLMNELRDIDLATAEGKLRLFCDAQPAANECTIPDLGEDASGNDAMDKAVQDMVFLVLGKLPNLTRGGLHLTRIPSKIDLTLHHTKELEDWIWMDENRYGILLSTEQLHTKVTSLNLSDSNLTVPSVLELLPKWTKLKDLNVSKNELSALPNTIGDLKALQSFDLSRCQKLTGLPDTIGDLKNLQNLDLQGCKNLEEFPEVITKMTQLTTLHIGGTNFTSLPDTVGKLENLQKLDLGGCRSLEELPATVGQLSSLTSLNLGGDRFNPMKLKALPETIGDLEALQSLTLWNCERLEGLPDTIGKLENLQDLNLRLCKSLTELPTTVSGLTALQTLNLENCRMFKGLPDTIGDLKNLQNLNLRRCENLEGLPDTIGDLKNLKDLDLFNCIKLEELPSTVGGLTSLQTLKLESCFSLTGLPETLYQLPLKDFSINSCQQLPMNTVELICQHMKQLEKLNIGNLFITGLPDTIGKLENLRDLNLIFCEKLEGLPNTIGDLKDLQKLDLQYCRELEVDRDTLKAQLPKCNITF